MQNKEKNNERSKKDESWETTQISETIVVKHTLEFGALTVGVSKVLEMVIHDK